METERRNLHAGNYLIRDGGAFKSGGLETRGWGWGDENRSQGIAGGETKIRKMMSTSTGGYYHNSPKSRKGSTEGVTRKGRRVEKRTPPRPTPAVVQGLYNEKGESLGVRRECLGTGIAKSQSIRVRFWTMIRVKSIRSELHYVVSRWASYLRQIKVWGCTLLGNKKTYFRPLSG